MKKVFSKTDEVAAIWAAQSQEEARTGSNTWCRGRKLFSYRTCIALITEDARGRLVAMIDAGGYGTTTAVVIGQAHHHAAANKRPVFIVERADDKPESHVENLRWFERRIGEALGDVERAIKPQNHRDRASRLIEEAKAYSKAFALGWKYTGRRPAAVLPKKERDA